MKKCLSDAHTNQIMFAEISSEVECQMLWLMHFTVSGLLTVASMFSKELIFNSRLQFAIPIKLSA